MIRAFVVAAAIVAGGWAGTAALADGEVGLVIQYAEGQTDTYCLAFKGDSVGGDQLLEMAGLPVNQFAGVICAIGGTGCAHSGSFDSCTCECKSGAGDCTYWSFFTQPYGETWRYSVLGFQSARARDGDLHAWRWGDGSAASAPPPGATTFEAVCGHAPGNVPSTAVPASTLPPATATASSSPTMTATIADPTPSGVTATAIPGMGASPTVTSADVAAPSATGTPAPPAAGDPVDEGTGTGGSNRGLIGFAIAAGALVAAIAAGAAWRQRHGN